MMTIDREIKNKVTEDWCNAFPELRLYAQDKLYKVVGPIIIGLELIKLPRMEEYRPHFVIYPLWEKDVKTSLSVPIILKEYYNNKGMQYNISYANHDAIFNGIAESLKKQIPLPFNMDISIRNLFSVMDEYSKIPPLGAAPDSYLQAVLQESKLAIALFISVEKAQSILQDIYQKKWDINHFRMCGVDINKWFENLQEKINKRNEFLKQIDINLQNKKIAQLKSSELIE